jgi:hypothetical protein
MASYTFDRNLQRYRSSNGRFISTETMKGLAEQAIALAKKDAGAIADLLVSGKLPLAEWQRGTALALKEMHLQAYMLGRGGRAMMAQRDFGLIGQRLQSEYGYLDQFAKDIKAGGMSEAQFRARLNQYLASARATYENARSEGHAQNGYTQEARILGDAKHCQPCIDYAAMGKQAIGTLPRIGQKCDCRSQCKCSFVFYRDAAEMALPRFGWVGNPFSLAMR